MQNLDNLADRLNEYNFYLGEPDFFVKDILRYQGVNVSDLAFACRKFLTKPYVELRVIPK